MLRISIQTILRGALMAGGIGVFLAAAPLEVAAQIACR